MPIRSNHGFLHELTRSRPRIDRSREALPFPHSVRVRGIVSRARACGATATHALLWSAAPATRGHGRRVQLEPYAGARSDRALPGGITHTAAQAAVRRAFDHAATACPQPGIDRRNTHIPSTGRPGCPRSASGSQIGTQRTPVHRTIRVQSVASDAGPQYRCFLLLPTGPSLGGTS